MPHSPGEWKAEKVGFGYHISSSERPNIAVVYGPTSNPESDDNLKAILSLPELIAALEKFVDRDFEYFGKEVNNHRFTYDEIQFARAALAKAQGK